MAHRHFRFGSLMLRAHALRLRFVDSRNLYICFRECPLFCCAIPISQEFPKIPNCPESEDAGQFVLLPRIRRRWAIRNWHENSKTLWIPPSMLLHILLIPGEDNHYVFCLHRHAFSRPFVSEKAVLPCVETEYPCCSSFLRGELVERCRCPLRSIMSRVFSFSLFLKEWARRGGPACFCCFHDVNFAAATFRQLPKRRFLQVTSWNVLSFLPLFALFRDTSSALQMKFAFIHYSSILSRH